MTMHRILQWLSRLICAIRGHTWRGGDGCRPWCGRCATIGPMPAPSPDVGLELLALHRNAEIRAGVISRLERDYAEMKREADAAERACAKAEAERDTASAECDRLTARMADLERQNVRWAGAEAERDKALAELAAERTMLVAVQAASDSNGRSVDRLLDDLAGAAAEIAALRRTPEIISRIRSLARELGWAIGVHGSLKRDIDLIGVPWTAEACDPDVLTRAIADGIGYTSQGHNLTARRPGGRRSILLFHPNAKRMDPPDSKGTWDPPAIDLSVVWVCGGGS